MGPNALFIAATIFLAPIDSQPASVQVTCHRSASTGCRSGLSRHVCIEYEFSIYEQRGVPANAVRPVVVFLHGAGAGIEEPADWRYRDFLPHLAESGYVVVSVAWHAGSTLTHPEVWEDNALSGLVAAFRVLEKRGTYQPGSTPVAFTGHSMGAMLSLRIAAMGTERTGLPAPRTVVMLDAAGYSFAPYLSASIRSVRRGHYTTAPYAHFNGVADDCLLVAIMSEETYDDAMEEEADGGSIRFGNENAGGLVSRAWWTTGIQEPDRHGFLVRGQRACQGGPVSSHGAMESPVDDVDRAYWFITDAALAAAFQGETGALDQLSSGMSECGLARIEALESVPQPRRFVWDCQLFATLHWAIRFFTPRGTCR